MILAEMAEVRCPLVVMALGPEMDALEGMPPTPSNFILRRAVPQLQVLQRCDAFVTHGGANSVHEGLRFGVPLAVVPIFGDQPSNADAIEQAGAGKSFRHPLATLTSSALRKAGWQLLGNDDSGSNTYRVAAQAMGAKIQAGGGAVAAADAILEHASCAAPAAAGGA